MDEGVVTSVFNADQAWHLAWLAATRQAIARFPELSPDEAGMIKASAVATYLADLRRCAEDAWREYVKLVALSSADCDAYFALGEPTHITLNQEEGAPVAHWNSNNPALAGAFGELLVPGDATTGVPAYNVSDPFKPVDLAALPEGTLKLPLTDSRHTATAAVHELVTFLERDLGRISSCNTQEQAWRAMLQHSRFLKAGARVALSHLQHDHYRDWNPHLPVLHAIQAAPRMVDRHAATTTAQQRIALHYVADAFSAMLAKCEDRHPDDAPQRVEMVLHQVGAARALLQQMVDGLNATVVASAGHDAQAHVAMVVFRPIGHTHPVFVAIPRASVAPPAHLPAVPG